jgi:colanic acid/amylovoran biosynthesis glycosyltransferase
VPQVGLASETFIRRHVNDLAPGRTVVVTQHPPSPFWTPDGPVLYLHECAWSLSRNLFYRIGRKIGITRKPDRFEAIAFMRSHGVGVFLGEYLDISLPWLNVVSKRGIRFFAHAHGYDVSKMLKQREWRARYRAFCRSDGIIVVSNHIKERLTGLGIPESKIHVIPCGTDVPDTRPLRRAESNTIRCLAVGRMVGKKAPLATLDALRIATKAVPQLRLEIVGDGMLLSAAKQYAGSSGLSNKVRFHGALPNDHVISLMEDSDIFVQHSITDPATGDEEGLPVAILESMAHGLPVVSTRHAGIPEAVVEGVTGFLVDEGDLAGMAERLVTLAEDRDLRLKMGTAGWRRAKEHFSWKREREELLAVLGI